MTKYTPVSGIYVILNTKNGMVYIGQAQDIRARWTSHKSRLIRKCHDNKYLQRAWNKYGAKSFKFQKLEYCAIENLDEREQHYLDIYLPKGLCYNLAVDAKSPSRGLKKSIETRQKISTSNKGKPKSEDAKCKNRESHIGRVASEETRQKMSAARKGKKHSDATREKIRLANIGKNKGKHPTEETLRKLSEASSRQSNIEHLHKLIERNKGRKNSAETIQRMRDAQRRRFNHEKHKDETIE